jgi:sporadic carbohydrate cluster protein (TIGR04323 family)
MNKQNLYTYPNENWENKTLNYDLGQFNWPKWVLETIQEIEPTVTDLTKIHEVISVDRIVKSQSYVQNAFSRKKFAERFDAFAEVYIKPLIDNQPYLLKRQATLNLVMPNQAAIARRLPFHQGIFYSNGRGQRTIWMALTRCEGTNSMYIADLEPSRAITKQVLEEKWNLSKFEEECLKVSRPVDIYPGQAHLFHQEHIHGNVNNTTGYTRMSIDWHVLPKGTEYGRRLPGGFFRLPGDYEQSQSKDYTGKTFVSYTNNNTLFSQGVPIVYQRLDIDRYCQKNKISYNSVQFENEYLDWLPILEDYIMQRPDGIVLASMYSLPDDIDRRDYIMNLALENKVELHFANELCTLQNHQDLTRIKTYMEWGIKTDKEHVWDN